MSDTHPARAFSEVLEDLGRGDGPRLTLHEVVDRFGERGFGALILVLSLVALFPWPPGGKALFGVAVVLMAGQLALLRHEVWLPGWAARASVSRPLWRKAGATILPWVARFERLSQPRLLFLTGRVADVSIGVTSMLMAVMMGTSAPLIDGLPAIALVLFGLGLMSRDGIVLILGWVMAAVSVAVFVVAWETVLVMFHGAAALFGHHPAS